MADGDNKDEKKKVPYARYAFLNPYNLALLGGAATVAAVTGNWMMGVAAVAGEALWMLFAPDSRLLRKVWFDKRHAALMSIEAKEELEKTLSAMPQTSSERCRALLAKKDQIERLCADNQAFTVDLLKGELNKLDNLVTSFIDLSVTCHRYAEYLGTVDLDGIERDIRRYSGIVDRVEKGDDRRPLALKNLEVLQRRKAKVAEIRQYLSKARGQLDLIENTFQLLADQIVTMRTPEELSGQLDSLMDGVEAVRETARETDRLLQAIER